MLILKTCAARARGAHQERQKSGLNPLNARYVGWLQKDICSGSWAVA